jgi:glucose uptake protein GlcU
MEWSSILAMFLEGMIPLVCLVCGILLIRWLKKKGVQEDELNYIQTAYSMLTKAVMSTNQIWVDTIKKAEGKLTEEQ